MVDLGYNRKKVLSIELTLKTTRVESEYNISLTSTLFIFIFVFKALLIILLELSSNGCTLPNLKVSKKLDFNLCESTEFFVITDRSNI